MAKMSNTEALQIIVNNVQGADKEAIAKALNNNMNKVTDREKVAHAFLDCIKHIQDEEIKKCARQVCKKYMNGAGLRDGEEEMYEKLIQTIQG